MDTKLIPGLKPPGGPWQLLAELPFNDLPAVYAEVRKLRHALISRFDKEQDGVIAFYYRGYHFQIVQVDDHIEIMVNDQNCPLDVLLEPLSRLITPLSRCRISDHYAGE